MKLRRLASFVSASAIIVGLLGQSASMVLATGANTQYWLGNGTTDGQIDNNDCNDDSSAHQLWIWTGDGTNVQISVDGEVVDGVQQGKNGAFHFATGWHDIGDLISGPGGNVFVTYDGAVDENAVVTLSHGCPGETTTTTTSEETTTSEQTTTEETTTEETTTSEETTTEETTTSEETTSSESTTSESTTSESTTTTTSFSQTVSGTTDVPTEPNTATIEVGGPASAGSSAWILIVALGLLLGSVVILTPAPSKTKR